MGYKRPKKIQHAKNSLSGIRVLQEPRTPLHMKKKPLITDQLLVTDEDYIPGKIR